MDITDKTPLEKVLESVPSTQPMYVIDNHRRTKTISTSIKPVDAKPINTLQLLHIIYGVMSGDLKPEDFELWTYENGVFHIDPDGRCDKIKDWDYSKAVDDIVAKIMENVEDKAMEDCDCGCSCGCH